MAKRKSKNNINSTGREKYNPSQFVQLSYGMLKHPNFLQLSPAASKILIASFIPRHNGYNNGEISLSYREISNELGISYSTVKRCLDELIDYGFLNRTVMGHLTGRKASEWEITFLKKKGMPPSDTWKEARKKKSKKKRSTPSNPIIDALFENESSLPE